MERPHYAPLTHARTLLFVPGNRPERLAKALASGADAVVLDLEDSVPPDEKPQARHAMAAAWPDLLASTVPLVIRINGLVSEAGREDLNCLASLPPPAGLMLSKAESPGQVQQITRALPGLPVLPLIESAAGYAELPAIAAAPGVLRLVVGHIDFMADTGIRCSPDERELDTLRFTVAVQTRINRLATAIDGVTVAIDDESRLQRDTRRALSFGFGAKLCIHPRQVAAVHAALRPTEKEVEWAMRVLAADTASGGAACRLDGQMLDHPVVLQARLTLARAPIDRPR